VRSLSFKKNMVFFVENCFSHPHVLQYFSVPDFPCIFSILLAYFDKCYPSILHEISSVRKTSTKNLEELLDKAVSCCYAR
jgi:hypothetical protein